MSSDIAIKIENLSKCYQIYEKPHHRLLQAMPWNKKQYYREFWALRDVSFEVKRGETVGILGRNGSGKSTLLQLVCGTLTPTSGTIRTNGRLAALLELGAGFNPEFTGRENVYMNASILGLTKDEIDARFDTIVAFADIGDFIEQPVKCYSSGMYVRLAFSVAISVEPQILVVDEALSVGDALFQKKCFMALNKLKCAGTTILFVSHDIWTVKSFTSRALILNTGNLLVFGSSPDICLKYNQLLFGGETDETSNTESTACHGIEKTPEQSIQKYGTGCAEISKITLTGLETINTVRGGETVTIKCYCKWNVLEIDNIVKNKQLSNNIIVGLLIRNGKHINVFGFNTFQKRIDINPRLQEEACVSFRFIIPNLVSGNYFVSPSIVLGSQENHEILAWYEDTIQLKCDSRQRYVFGMFDVETEITIDQGLTV